MSVTLPAPSSPANRIDSVARVTVGLMSLALVIMLARVAQLQLAPSQQLSSHIQSRIAHRTVAAPRSDLVDRRFRPLASTQFGYRVFVDPTELPEPPDEAIARLAETINVPADEIGGKVILAIARNKNLAPDALKADEPKGLKGLLQDLFSPPVASELEAELDPETASPVEPTRKPRPIR